MDTAVKDRSYPKSPRLILNLVKILKPRFRIERNLGPIPSADTTSPLHIRVKAQVWPFMTIDDCMNPVGVEFKRTRPFFKVRPLEVLAFRYVL
jgi:hypothetical protein